MLKDKFKALIVSQNEKDSKKKIENIVVFIIILIITVIAINSIWGGDKTAQKEEDTNKEITKQLANTEEIVETSTSEETIEKKIETILSNIEGVGKVRVLITYKESSEVVAMYNENNKNSTIEEKDSGRRNKNNNTSRHTKRHSI